MTVSTALPPPPPLSGPAAAPPSPPATRHQLPSWLDPRLVLGVLLVLVSVLVGAQVVASADRTVRVWAVNADLAAGTVLDRGDLQAVRVRLVDNRDRYVRTTERSVPGRTLTRDVGRGELLPVRALAARPCGSEVSIPVTTRHAPASVRRGARIDVFATTKGDQAGRTVQVLQNATVQSVLRPQGGILNAASEWSVIVRVEDDQAATVVQAVRTADIDITVLGTARGRTDGCGTVPDGVTAPGGAVADPPRAGRPDPGPAIPSTGPR